MQRERGRDMAALFFAPMRAHVRTLGALLATLAACESPVAVTDEGTIPIDQAVHLHYMVVGTGPDTVMVLHGGPGLHSAYLLEPLRPLAPRRTLIFYDQRGRGRSDPPPDSLGYSAAQDVADLESVRRFFHLERFTVIGHGWGAGLAALYAVDHPDRVSRLLLISPMFPRGDYLWDLTMHHADGRDTSALEGLMAARVAGLDTSDPVRFCRQYWGAMVSPTPIKDRSVVRRLSGTICDAPASALRRVELINRRINGSLGGWDWHGRLAAIHAPVLVVQARGAETWLASAREWVASLPDARLAVIGSIPQFPWLDGGSRFITTAGRFLDGAWPIP
jgi:proline iminopeptidase